MPRRRRRLKPILAIFSLFAFLGLGLSVRIFRGPYKDTSGLLTPVIPVAVTQRPGCLEVGNVPRGSTLAEVLEDEGVRPEEAREWVGRLGSLFDLRRVRTEHQYRILSHEDGSLMRLEFQPDDSGFYVVEADSTGTQLNAWHENEPFDRRYRKVGGKVSGSLYTSMVKQGLDAGLVSTFCDVFSYDVDFATETKDGDTFECLVEERLRDGRPFGTMRLLSGQYKNGPEVVQAYWYEPSAGKGGWYRADGQALKRAYLKSPLNYTRISSGFTQNRLHPIFKTVRPHLGVDYAAPTGTPVVAVADGSVESVGWVNGYGKLVVVRHANGVETYYAHLSNYGRGLKAGASVNQNQVIGYVGQTGHATGPHLDFRVAVNGRFVNPLTFK
ncbi:MAG TPA: peptidoglycan DD-metalloendopeptidase family protein, partial [Candidatus Eisenbacteria bacterium]